MERCPNCGKELEHIKGRRKKKYCKDACRVQHWQKTHKSNKEPKFKLIPIEEYNELKQLRDGTIVMKATIGKKIVLNGTVNLDKPIKMKGEDGVSYAIRLAQWKEQNK